MRHAFDVYLHGKQYEGCNNSCGTYQGGADILNQTAQPLDRLFCGVAGLKNLL